jgi:putative DNA primase/helicase
MKSIDHAIQYAERGWHVLPLHSVVDGKCTCGKVGCTSAGKHPQTPNGLRSATIDLDTINTWFKYWPKANIGIATGAISGIGVVDIDPKHGGGDTLDELTVKYGKIPDTVEAITQSSGRHIIFQYEEGFRTTAGKLGRGIDTRGDGGYIVAAPSKGLLGEYHWEASSDPSDHPIVRAPRWILQLLNVNKELEFETEKIGEGLRSSYLCSIGGALRSRGVSFKAILACLVEENLARCEPPVSNVEVFTIAKSMMNYSPKVEMQKLRISKNASVH